MYVESNGTVETLYKGAAGVNGGDTADSTIFGGAPTLSDGGYVYFNGLDDRGSYDLMVFDEATNKTTVLELPPSKVFGYLNPQDLVLSAGVIYLVGDTNVGQLSGTDFTLWTTNGTLSGTHEVSGSPADNGQMASYASALYFNGDDNISGGDNSDNDLMVYAKGKFSKAAGTSDGLDPLGTVSGTLSNGSKSVADLFLNGADSANDRDLFAYNGSKLTLIGASGLDPRDLVIFGYGHSNGTTGGASALAFNGVDNSASKAGVDGQKTGRGLYIATVGSTGAITDSLVAAGLDPQDITALDGEIFFAGVDGKDLGQDAHGEGLWAYNPSAKPGAQLTEIVASSNYDLDLNGSVLGTLQNPQPQIAASGGELFFSATHGGTVEGLFEYNPLTNAISAHLGGTAGALPYNLTPA